MRAISGAGETTCRPQKSDGDGEALDERGVSPLSLLYPQKTREVQTSMVGSKKTSMCWQTIYTLRPDSVMAR
jgi:hypothetical protein